MDPASGGPVLVLSGFGIPSRSVHPLATTLRARGLDATVAPLGLNIGCGEATVGRLLELVDQLRPAALVGHSRGGQLALVVAVRRPDLIRRLVTVGTPWSVGPPDRPGVAATARALRAARRHGVDPMPSIECGTGACCVRYRHDLQERPSARWTGLWSSTDKVAGADSRPPSQADEAEDLRIGHLAMILTARGRTAIADCLTAG